MWLLDNIPEYLQWSKKPEMDSPFATGGTTPLNLLCTQILLAQRSKAEDYRFIKISPLEENCPDFHGFNTNEARIAGQAPKPKSKTTFRQLIEQTPSEPPKILTLMVDAEKVINATGQKITAYCRSAALQHCS